MKGSSKTHGKWAILLDMTKRRTELTFYWRPELSKKANY